MISVSYVAPLGSSSPRGNSCGVDPYDLLSSRTGGKPYIVEVEGEWQDARLSEGDLLIVDEDKRPKAGDIGIYTANRKFHACRVHIRNGMLCPKHYDARGNEHNVTFAGTVVRMVRFIQE